MSARQRWSRSALPEVRTHPVLTPRIHLKDYDGKRKASDITTPLFINADGDDVLFDAHDSALLHVVVKSAQQIDKQNSEAK